MDPRNTASPGDSARDDAIEQALDDLDGLFEATRALADRERTGDLLRKQGVAKNILRELSAAADAYAATLAAAARGVVDAERIDRCREAAIIAMPTAVERRKSLATVVSQKRLAGVEVRNDLRELINLSLHCRAALDALGPTVDRRAAEAIGNKILVELREAALIYLAVARQVGDGSSEKARASVVPLLEKAEAHAKGFEALAKESTGETADTPGVSMSKDVVCALHLTSLKWTANTDDAAEASAP